MELSVSLLMHRGVGPGVRIRAVGDAGVGTGIVGVEGVGPGFS